MTNVPKTTTAQTHNATSHSTETPQSDATDIYRELHQNSEPEAPPKPRSPLVPHPETTSPQQWVGHSFADRASAERAYELLLERGYESQEINVLMTTETRERHFSDLTEDTALRDKAKEGQGEKAAAGAFKGAVIGTILTAGANFVLPGFGLFLGGPLFIGLGALTGGLGAVLAEAGVPQEQAVRYEEDVKTGRIVLGVVPHNEEDAEYFARVWKTL